MDILSPSGPPPAPVVVPVIVANALRHVRPRRDAYGGAIAKSATRHTQAIDVDDTTAAAWCLYRANASRDRVELAPAAAFNVAAVRARLVAQIDIDVDAVYAAVVGQSQRQI